MSIQQISLEAPYDFPRVTNYLRSGQMLCVLFQIFLLHSDSGSLSFTAFFFYSVLIALTSVHLTVRWYYNIDGRYDVRQVVREQEYRIKSSYAVALYSPLVCGFLAYKCVSLTPGLPANAFWFVSLCQWLMAFALASLEGYEVFLKN